MEVKKGIEINGVEHLDEPIQISDGVLCCPHCGDDLNERLGVALAPNGDVMVPMKCGTCHAVVGIEFSVCPKGHVHIGWVEAVKAADKSLN